MSETRLTPPELQIMEVIWARSDVSIREIQDALPDEARPAYTTVQTVVYRLEAKGLVRRTRKVGNFHMFAAVMSRHTAQRRLVDDLLAIFGGKSQPLMAHLIEAGNLSLDDIKDAEQLLKANPASSGRGSGKRSAQPHPGRDQA